MTMGSVQAVGLILVGAFEGGCFPQPPAEALCFPAAFTTG